jgi:hypothetical protein
MRHSITTLLFIACAAISAFAQDPAPASTDPTTATTPATTPAPEATPEASPAPAAESVDMTATDQEFLEIPGEPGQTEPLLVEEEVSLTGEMPIPSETDQDYIDPNALVPDLPASPAPIDPRSLALAGAEQERKLKVRYREVRTKAEKVPAIISLREKAETSKTFEGERAAYREYYRALFRKMRQLDKSLSKKCDLMEKTYLDRLAQTRIEPTIPLEPPPKPEPLAN